jgi:RNA polymerase sigma-54 factor
MEERAVSKEAPLEDYLYQQLRLEVTDPEEIRIGEFIIGNLDENGYFHSSLDEAAATLNTGIEQIRKVLNVVQNFEPLGIAARDIKECLNIQAHYLFVEEDGALAERIITEHLEDLGHKRYAEIARQLGVPSSRVKDIARLISNLDPKPARKFRPIEDNIYVKPDVIVTKNSSDEFEVQSIQGNFPPLRISSYYQGLLQQKNLSEEERTFIQEKVRNAILFMRSIEQRQETILAIAKYIVAYQKDFFQEEGLGVLKPMVLRDVAGGIERNESTVSRAINNKYMDTPFGIFSMKYFFSQAVSENNSNRSIQEEIKSLIEQEDKGSPMSDQDIQHYFSRKGVNIARRTINKYRKVLHILPSHLRKN